MSVCICLSHLSQLFAYVCLQFVLCFFLVLLLPKEVPRCHCSGAFVGTYEFLLSPPWTNSRDASSQDGRTDTPLISIVAFAYGIGSWLFKQIVDMDNLTSRCDFVGFRVLRSTCIFSSAESMVLPSKVVLEIRLNPH